MNSLTCSNRVTDALGAVVWQAEEFPFGDLYSQSGTSSTPLRFPGQYDESSGLYENRWRSMFPKLGRYSQPDPLFLDPARYYYPTVGRFVSEDPLRESYPGLYPYVKNNPILFKDPSGLKCADVQNCLECFKKNAPPMLADAASKVTWECVKDVTGCPDINGDGKPDPCGGFAQPGSNHFAVIDIDVTPSGLKPNTCFIVAHEIAHAVYSITSEPNADGWATLFIPKCCKNK